MKTKVFNDRMHRGISQQEMADLIGVSVDVIRNLEATGNRPRWANARKIAEFYGMTILECWPLDHDAGIAS